MSTRNVLRLLPLAVGLVLMTAPVAAQGFRGGFRGERHHHGGGRSGFSIGFGGPVARQVFVPGHYETVAQQVWIPGECRRVWCEPAYETCYDACGRPYQRCARAGYWRTEESPGRYETRYVQTWVDGYWTTVCN